MNQFPPGDLISPFKVGDRVQFKQMIPRVRGTIRYIEAIAIVKPIVVLWDNRHLTCEDNMSIVEATNEGPFPPFL